MAKDYDNRFARISARIPIEVYEKLEAIANNKHKKLTDVILESFLNFIENRDDLYSVSEPFKEWMYSADGKKFAEEYWDIYYEPLLEKKLEELLKKIFE